MESSKDFQELTVDYNNLLEKFQQLQTEHEDLKTEYQENTIIQSMNEMKERYEQIVNTTVSLFKFNMMEKKFNDLYRTASAASVILDHIKKCLSDLNGKLYSATLVAESLKIESELNLIQELLENCLQD